MKDFGRAGGRLRALPFHARLVYSVFLVFTLAAVGLTGWLTDDIVGLDLGQLGEYYAGEPPSTVDSSPAPAGGPELVLPEDLVEPGSTGEPMSRRKLLEVTHFHLFSMPLYLLILSHLFMLSRQRGALKTGWIAAASLATAAHIAAPWVATGGGPAATALYGGSGALLAASYLVMGLIPLWEMWSPVGRPPSGT